MKTVFISILVALAVCLPACKSTEYSPIVPRKNYSYYQYYYTDEKGDTVRFSEDRLLILEKYVEYLPEAHRVIKY